MVKALVVSRVCYGARQFWLNKSQWKRLETRNNQARRLITDLLKFTPLSKLREYAQINELHDIVQARIKAHDEQLKLTKQGRGIMYLLLKPVQHLPELIEQLPPWEDLPANTESKPNGVRKGGIKQAQRRAKAHGKMVESWDRSKTVAAYTDSASLDGPISRKTAAVVFPTL